MPMALRCPSLSLLTFACAIFVARVILRFVTHKPCQTLYIIWPRFRNHLNMKNNRKNIIINQYVIILFLGRLLEWVLPARCPLTGDSVERQGMISPLAWATLRFVANPCCFACGMPLAVS